MANDTTMTVVGNLTDNPDYRVTPTGVGLVRFTVASTPRLFDQKANQWKDGKPLFLNCTAWRDIAENFAESFKKGDRVVVIGKLHQTEWETQEGEKRRGFQLDVDEIGASVRYARVKVMKLTRQTAPGTGNAPADDPWAAPSAQDEPPF